MGFFILILVFYLGLNIVPVIAPVSSPKVRRIVIGLLITSTLLFFVFTLLNFNDFMLRGRYSFRIVLLFFGFSVVCYATLIKNSIQKAIFILLLTPLSLFALFLFPFGQLQNSFPIDKNRHLITITGGFMSFCGEAIQIVEPKYGLFYKYKHLIRTDCLEGIYKIEITKFDDTQLEFLVYHNGNPDELENPYKFSLENDGYW